MLGPEVLDAERYREIIFRSTTAEQAGSGPWSAHGTLTLRGVSRLATVNVSEKSGHYVGILLIKQSDFGMKPVKAAGGTVKTKDEVRIQFDIQLTRQAIQREVIYMMRSFIFVVVAILAREAAAQVRVRNSVQSR